MCKDVPTKMMKMFLLVQNLRQKNPDNREDLGIQILGQFFIRYRDFLHRYLSAFPSDKILEPNNTLEDRKELSQPG
nr:hypothetical protein [Tanacetum cinerariifolium]